MFEIIEIARTIEFQQLVANVNFPDVSFFSSIASAVTIDIFRASRQIDYPWTYNRIFSILDGSLLHSCTSYTDLTNKSTNDLIQDMCNRLYVSIAVYDYEPLNTDLELQEPSFIFSPNIETPIKTDPLRISLIQWKINHANVSDPHRGEQFCMIVSKTSYSDHINMTGAGRYMTATRGFYKFNKYSSNDISSSIASILQYVDKSDRSLVLSALLDSDIRTANKRLTNVKNDLKKYELQVSAINDTNNVLHYMVNQYDISKKSIEAISVNNQTPQFKQEIVAILKRMETDQKNLLKFVSNLNNQKTDYDNPMNKLKVAESMLEEDIEELLSKKDSLTQMKTSS